VSTNALDPNLMTAAERLREVGEILAAGLLRLRAREEQTTAGRAAKTTDPRKQPRQNRRMA
jgi:hypothetical protein